MLNGVLIMVLVTSILGPVLTQHFAARMLGGGTGSAVGDAIDPS